MSVEKYRRKSPEDILREMERLRRGRHKVFLGAAAGVGKTYAMLGEAHVLRERGIHVVAGIIESHGRTETEALLEGLERIPPTVVLDRGVSRRELDVDAVIARGPDVVLVDELAHLNPPAFPRGRRYQDVLAILDTGIHVHSTLNIQHLESLNDIVAQITGVRVRETVPDEIVTGADEIRLIDLAPSALIQRLEEGKVYPPEEARRALERFFRRGNLTALRELALRTVADATDEDLEDYMRGHGIAGPWPAAERVLVCVTSHPNGQGLIRRGYRMAQRLKAKLYVATVLRPGYQPGRSEAQGLDLNLRLAREFGAQIIQEQDRDPARRLVQIADGIRATQILLGASKKTRWEELREGSIIHRILRETSNADVTVVADLTEAGRT